MLLLGICTILAFMNWVINAVNQIVEVGSRLAKTRYLYSVQDTEDCYRIAYRRWQNVFVDFFNGVLTLLSTPNLRETSSQIAKL